MSPKRARALQSEPCSPSAMRAASLRADRAAAASLSTSLASLPSDAAAAGGGGAGGAASARSASRLAAAAGGGPPHAARGGGGAPPGLQHQVSSEGLLSGGAEGGVAWPYGAEGSGE
jgi:hypothetical protein